MIKTKFWIFCALVLIVVGANFYYTAQRLQSGVLAVAEDSLGRGEARLAATEALETAGPREAVRVAARIPELREALMAAAAVESPPDSAAFEKVVSLLGEAAGRGDAPLHRRIMLSTADGTSDLHVERPMDVRAPPPDISALRAALGGEFGSGLLHEEGELLRVVAAPVVEEGAVAGAVLLGYAMDDAYLRRVAEAIGADVSVVVGGSVLASTLPADQRGTLGMAARRAALGGTFGFGEAAGPISSLTAPLTGAEPASGYARKIVLGGLDDAFTVISVPAGPHFGWVEEYQTYQVAAAGLLLLVGLIWGFFVAVSVNQPVRRMIAQMSRAASGDVKTRLEPSKFRGELRRMAELLNGVLDQAERKAPVGAKKEQDISSLLTDQPSEPEAPAPDDFDFGFGKKEASSAAAETPRAPEPPAPVESASPPLDPSVAPLDEPVAPSGPRVETEEDDPFAVFGQEQEAPEPEPEPVYEPEAAPQAEEDPFAAFADQAPTGDMAAAASASADDYYEDDSTRVVSLGDMEAAAKAAEPPRPAAPPAPVAAPKPAMAMADPFAAAMSDSGDDDDDDYSPDATVVAKVPAALLQATARAAGAGASAAPQDPDEAHFREVFRSFVTTRQKCGEPADGLTFDKFAVKLRKNRDTIKEKHGARSVRFQVYVKEGKAALKATPVR